MQVPVYIGSYIYKDQTSFALIWETKKAKQSQTNRGKKITRKWQGNKMVYLEPPQKNDSIPWIASCSNTLDEFKEAKKTCKEHGFTMFHFHSYELADSQENRLIRR